MTDLQLSSSSTTENFDESEQDYWHTAGKELNKCPMGIQVHVVIAVVLSLGSLFVSHYVGVQFPDYDYYYWIYVVALFSSTLLFHYYFNQSKYWKGITGVIVVVNITCVLSWGVSMHKINSQNEGYVWINPWWMYVAYFSILFVEIYNALVKEDTEYFKLWLKIYWMSNLFLFLTWLFLRVEFPWFLIPLFFSTMGIVGYKMGTAKVAIWLHLLAQLSIINIGLFFVWQFTAEPFPWFMIVAIISVVVIGVAFILRPRKLSNSATV
eukprot:TRINITY_DN10393_c0_g1_i1.p1 TRINITY_DN10393_c0_g1~~TRINITY_DN10393_c0_g1_i1.p1  ORF type:complete len:266 (+),score=38.25 TRINITY_DN10393_c0_g1_i1:14-811(+)